MKLYSTIITIVAVSAIGAGGYFCWQNSLLNKKVVSLEEKIDIVQKDSDNTKQELVTVNESLNGIKPFSAALKAVLGSFIAGGDTKVGTIGTTEAGLAKQKIGEISDSADKISTEEDWNNFSSSEKLRDLQPLLSTLSNGIERHIQNVTDPPK